MNSKTDELLTFFKALADANRLRIVGLLAERELAVEELAAILGLKPSTVSHHLARLAEAGLVNARAQSYYSVYSLDTAALEEMARRLLSREALPAIAADADVDAFDRKVVSDYSLPDGRLKTIPAQLKKLQAVLRHIVKCFEPGVKYPEKVVNEILARFHEDTATLRRELIGNRLMAREAGDYWRIDRD